MLLKCLQLRQVPGQLLGRHGERVPLLHQLRVLIEGGEEAGIGVGEAGAEVGLAAVAVGEVPAEARDVGLEAGDAGGDGHGGDLARDVQLLVRVGGDHGQDLVGGDELGTAEEGHGPAGEKEEAAEETVGGGSGGGWPSARPAGAGSGRAAAARLLGLDLACSGVGVRGGDGNRGKNDSTQ